MIYIITQGRIRCGKVSIRITTTTLLKLDFNIT